MATPSNRDPDHWDTVCISFLTLATAVLVGLFTLFGLSDEALKAGRLRIYVLIVGMLALAAYFFWLAFARGALFADSAERKRSGARDVVHVFIAEATAVAVTATLIVWSKIGAGDGANDPGDRLGRLDEVGHALRYHHRGHVGVGAHYVGHD